MSIDPKKAILYIQGNAVRYKQGGTDGSIKRFNSNPKTASFQGKDIIVHLENGKFIRIIGPSFSNEEPVR